MTQCTDCDGGKHCSVEGSTAVTGDCDAGYYCQSGVDRPNPDNSATNSTYPPTCPLIGGHTGRTYFFSFFFSIVRILHNPYTTT